MPYQNALFIAYVIEYIIFVLATSPEPEHVLICIDGCLNSFIVNIRNFECTGHKHVGRNVIRTAHEDRDTVELQVERGSLTIQIRFLDPVDGSDTITYGTLIQNVLISKFTSGLGYLHNHNSECIERLGAEVPGPPELCILDCELKRDLVFCDILNLQMDIWLICCEICIKGLIVKNFLSSVVHDY